jgi:mono/diheme cytochrome c family protein
MFVRWTIALVLVAALAGCGGSDLTAEQERGREAIAGAGCGGCHTIGGVDQADADFGPNLEHLSDRRSIAGSLPNDHQALVRWILDPSAVNPNTLMPDLDVNRRDAEAIATYLETGQ